MDMTKKTNLQWRAKENVRACPFVCMHCAASFEWLIFTNKSPVFISVGFWLDAVLHKSISNYLRSAFFCPFIFDNFEAEYLFMTLSAASVDRCQKYTPQKCIHATQLFRCKFIAHLVCQKIELHSFAAINQINLYSLFWRRCDATFRIPYFLAISQNAVQ